MGFHALTAGETGSLNKRVEKYDMAAQNIAKGQICVLEEGNVTIATTTNTVGNAPCVALEAKDNSGGSPGDLQILVALAPTQAAVQTKSTLEPGDYVKVATTAGTVTEFIDGTDDVDLIVGRYTGKDTGVFARAGTTPFRETLSNNEDPPADAAVDDIVFIELIDK